MFGNGRWTYANKRADSLLWVLWGRFCDYCWCVGAVGGFGDGHRGAARLVENVCGRCASPDKAVALVVTTPVVSISHA